MISFEFKSLVDCKIKSENKIQDNRFRVELVFLDSREAEKLTEKLVEYLEKKKDGV